MSARLTSPRLRRVVEFAGVVRKFQVRGVSTGCEWRVYACDRPPPLTPSPLPASGRRSTTRPALTRLLRMPSRLQASQKRLHRFDEKLRLVVMDPMPGVLHHDDTGVLEMMGAAVLLRICGPAFLAVDEQRRARDVGP